MPVVGPFRAVRHNPAQFPDLTPLLTPPYDVISPQEQDIFYDLHPYNMIRLDLGKSFPADSSQDNRYSRAARCFQDWQARQVLIQDDAPALYPASIQYTSPAGESKTLLGFFGLVRLEAFETGQILPHEWTFSAAKQDRLSLLRACRANFSPIFFLTSDPQGHLRRQLRRAIESAEPVGQSEEQHLQPDGSVRSTASHALWKLTAPDLVAELVAAAASSPLLIADGHHRYETALNYQREAAAGAGTTDPAGYCLGFIADSHDPGLSILATHRVLRQIPEFDSRALLDRLKGRFSITSLPASTSEEGIKQLLDDMQQRGQSQPTVGLICRGIDAPQVLTYGQPAAAQLDVRVLQTEILEQLLGVQEEAAVGAGQLVYVKDPFDAARRLATGNAQAVFFLNPTPIEAIEAIARGGGRMPRKTTYFLPKPLTGGVIYRLDPSSISP